MMNELLDCRQNTGSQTLMLDAVASQMLHARMCASNVKATFPPDVTFNTQSGGESRTLRLT